MSISEREKMRDFFLFFGGVVLGILGNVLAEFIIAFTFPDGVISSYKALRAIIILAVTITIEVIIVYIYIRKVF